MIDLVVKRRAQLYSGRVQLVSKLLLLFSVLLLPLGMQPAVATPTAHHEMAMPMAHCPDQGSKHELKGGFAECTMVCSAALPAAELTQPEAPWASCAPATPRIAQVLHGLQPETATPPPRQS